MYNASVVTKIDLHFYYILQYLHTCTYNVKDSVHAKLHLSCDNCDRVSLSDMGDPMDKMRPTVISALAQTWADISRNIPFIFFLPITNSDLHSQ